MLRRTLIAAALVAQALAPVRAQSHGGSGHHDVAPATGSSYAGEERRAIKALSKEDVDTLRRGGGWGLARAAELNGAPGPAHVLELEDELGLDAEQAGTIGALHARMKREAVRAGTRFIEAERALDEAFRTGPPAPDALERLVRDAAEARGALRLVHLHFHLDTLPVLTPAQIARYRVLRGYAEGH